MAHSLNTPVKDSKENLMNLMELSRQGQGKQIPVIRIPIHSLFSADSPRLCGENMEHARALAESEAEFPPIIVHRATMQIIDGMHRMRAAVLRGQDDISVQFFDGDMRDAFVLAVRANIAHGMPLSLADRTAAAARIIGSHPRWSDRAIAFTTGLAAKTVGAIRRRSTEAPPQLNTRIGRDGRVRPLNTTEGRRIASELMVERPDASIREVASAAGISVGTAQDVRKRLRSEQNHISPKRHDANRQQNRPGCGESVPQHDLPTMRISIEDSISILNNLKKDPSLRFTNTGRVLLRLLHALAISAAEWEQLINSVPVHCTSMVSRAAHTCADMWRKFAERLERR